MSIHRYFSRFAMLIVALPFLCSFTAQAQTSPFDVADHKQIRVIISADAKNEADDDFAVAHAVLTPTTQVKGLISAHYSRTAPLMKRDGENSMMESYHELQRLMKVMGKTDIPVYRGATQALKADGGVDWRYALPERRLGIQYVQRSGRGEQRIQVSGSFVAGAA
ncbi:hypothetical protein [Pectobacterium versatile]|uniref:hypothetical protein n=1 Tax=Pectobacterium versatile TaxID=2488639 RepID=UPI001CCB1DDB|nr:hypothetical protein [Pectobacterium versatile]